MPPHSLLRACSAGVPCGIQSHATSQSLTSLFGWCALRHSEPCHLTVSYEPVRLVCPAAFRAMPPHSLLRACSAGVPCGIQSHATSQSLTSLFGWCALRHSEPCHLTVSYEPVRLVCPAAFRAMPPHSLLRACSAGVPCGIQSHATSQSLTSLFGWCALRHSEPCHLTVSYEPVRLVCPAAFRAMPPHSLLRACSAGVPCGIQSHATSQSLTSLFGWCALRHSEPCHLTVSYEPVRLVCPAAFRAMPPHSLLRACSAGVPCGIQSHATSQSLTSLFGAAYPPYSTI